MDQNKLLEEDGSYSTQLKNNNNLTLCNTSSSIRNKTSKIRSKKRNGVSAIEFEESTAALIRNELGLFKLESPGEKSKSSHSNLRYPWVSYLSQKIRIIAFFLILGRFNVC
jgi:hypothetical protein